MKESEGIETEMLKRLKTIEDYVGTIAVEVGDSSMPSDLRNELEDIGDQLREALKRLDNIEAHLGIVPADELGE